MIKTDKTISKHIYLSIIFTIVCAGLFAVSCNHESEASDFPDCFVGTYINEESSGAKSMWNLYKDGNFSGESSTQEVLNFSGQIGSWIKTGNREAHIVLIDFSFDEDGVEKNIARADIDITFIGDNCEETEGSFELRFFEDGEDPLDISTDDGEVIEDTFTGRKLLL